MPNWCKNNLKIISNGQKVLDLLEILKDEDGQMTFNKFLPMPKELEDTTSPTPKDVSKEEQKRLIEKYGATNWYDWHCANWGVKWDASESGFYKNGDDWMVSFQTPWGPPIEFLQALSKTFKEFQFELQYADEGYGQQPLGEAVLNDGSVFYDGPEEGTAQAEAFAECVWGEEWVDDYAELKNNEEEE